MASAYRAVFTAADIASIQAGQAVSESIQSPGIQGWAAINQTGVTVQLLDDTGAVVGVIPPWCQATGGLPQPSLTMTVQVLAAASVLYAVAFPGPNWQCRLQLSASPMPTTLTQLNVGLASAPANSRRTANTVVVSPSAAASVALLANVPGPINSVIGCSVVWGANVAAGVAVRFGLGLYLCEADGGNGAHQLPIGQMLVDVASAAAAQSVGPIYYAVPLAAPLNVSQFYGSSPTCELRAIPLNNANLDMVAAATLFYA